MSSEAGQKLSHLIMAILLLAVSSPAWAQVVITQAKANKGNVTAGDAAGFPVTISTRGSYRLGSNLFISNADTTAIEITADNVTLDLNGFTIFGPNVCTRNPTPVGSFTTCNANGSGRGINTGNSNIAVINGTVTGMGEIGVLTGTDSRIENVRAISNGGDGLRSNDRSLVRNSEAIRNGGNGIYVDAVFTPVAHAGSSLITDNITVANDGGGISVPFSFGNTFVGNTANDNGWGVQVFCPSNVIANTAIGNRQSNFILDFSGCNTEHNLAP